MRVVMVHMCSNVRTRVDKHGIHGDVCGSRFLRAVEHCSCGPKRPQYGPIPFAIVLFAPSRTQSPELW